MVIICLAPGCTAKKDSTNSRTSVLFHRFPLRKPDILAKWVKAMKNPNFRPTVKSYLCSAHFTEADYEMKPNNGGKHLKSTSVPTVFEKRRPGRKKKLLSENEISEEIKEEEEIVFKHENDEIVEEEYLETFTSDKEESNLSEIISNQDKETLQILIVGEDGKITNSEYIFKKELFSDDESKYPGILPEEEIRDQDTDDEYEHQSKRHLEHSCRLPKGAHHSSDITTTSYKDLKNQEKMKKLEMNLMSSRKKVEDLQIKCKKLNRKMNRLKILLKLLVLKRGKGEKNLKQLLDDYERELEDLKVKVKEEESDF